VFLSILVHDLIICVILLLRRYLERCTLEMFDEFKADELTAFIMSHMDKEKHKDFFYTSKSGLPIRGKLSEAQSGAVNKIKVAFELRGNTNSLRNEIISNTPVIVDESSRSIMQIEEIILGSGAYVFPSELLSNEPWVQYVVELLHLDDMALVVLQHEKDKADQLCAKLRDRLRNHLNARVKEKSKHTHWSMILAHENLAVCAACMVLSNHVKLDLTCIGSVGELLGYNSGRFVRCEDFPEREGAYLYYDRNDECFIRSGKVTRRGFSTRDNEHRKASASANSSKSHFYFLYPSKTSPRNGATGTKGSFENLVQLIAAGFERESTAAAKLDRDWKEGGLLILSDEMKEKIRSRGGMGNSLSHIQKFQDICAYQMELGYDLAINPNNNVSQNPGFESVLGVICG
jgi:hypothetical protein